MEPTQKEEDGLKKYVSQGSLTTILVVQIILLLLGLCLLFIRSGFSANTGGDFYGMDIGNAAYGLGMLVGLLILAFQDFGAIFMLFVIGTLFYAFGIKKQKNNKKLAQVVAALAAVLSVSIMFLFVLQYKDAVIAHQQDQQYEQQHETSVNTKNLKNTFYKEYLSSPHKITRIYGDKGWFFVVLDNTVQLAFGSTSKYNASSYEPQIQKADLVGQTIVIDPSSFSGQGQYGDSGFEYDTIFEQPVSLNGKPLGAYISPDIVNY